MKFRWILIVAMVAILILSACQSETSGTGEPTQASGENLTSEQPQEEAPAAEQPGVPYPGPGQEPAVEDFSAYPDPLFPDLSDGDEIEWEQASAMIMNGEVSMVTWESSSARTTLGLKDGRLVIVIVEDPEVIHRTISECGEICSNILFNQE